MADGTKVGSAYVEVTPKAKGNFGDILDKEISRGGEKGREFGSAFASGLSGAVSAGAVAVGNILSDVIKSGAAAARDLVGEAVGGFADFEQLSGGVEKLFGTDAASTVMANAESAFASAGLSANEYMEQVTSFSASLIGSLEGDTQTAANMADVAMRNMSDNANTFGTDIESIQNAYQGFAKGNFTMLDNLKLGYGGTKEEMERLLHDAEEMAGYEFGSMDVSNFADVVEALDIVQTDMNISGLTAETAAEMVAAGALTEEEAFERMGTTAREASKTVDGSFHAMQASWQNWVAALGNPEADLDAKTGGLAKTVETYLGNVVPVVERAVSGVAEALPDLVSQIAPIVMPALSNVIASVTSALPSFISAAAPVLMSAAGDVVGGLASALPALVGQVGTSLMPAIAGMIGGIASSLPGLVSSIVPVLVPAAVSAATTVIPALLSLAPALLEAGLQLFLGLVQAAVVALPLVAQAVVAAAPQLGAAALEFFSGLGTALGQVVPMLFDALGWVVTHIPEILAQGVTGLVEAGKSFFGGFIDGITGKAPEADAAAASAAAGAVDAAVAASDASAAGGAFGDSLAAGYDFSQFSELATQGVEAATQAAAQSADGAAIAEQLSATTAGGVDLAAMEQPATEMAENAVQAAKAVDATTVGADFSAAAAAGVDTSAMSDAIAQASGAADALNRTATVSVRADLGGVGQLRSASGEVSSAFLAMEGQVSSSMARAARSASDAASSISATIANIPDATVYVNVARGSVSLPHFSMSGTFDAKKGTVPTVSVEWYAKGAIFEPNRPGIIGIGDARVPEVAAPLDALRDMLGIDSRDDDAPRVAVNLNYRAGEDANRLARDTARALDRIQRTRR